MASEERLPQEEIDSRAEEYFTLKDELNQVNAQASLLRKSLKAAEKHFVNGMIVNQLEEYEREGRKLSRTRAVKCED